MKHVPFGRSALLVVLGGLLGLAAGHSPPVRADAISNATTQRAPNYALDPPLGIAGAAPLVMLNLSRDHQLFYKAYNDFTDLDGNGTLDTTFSNAQTYAGYFDAKKCYSYDSGKGYFIPSKAVGSDGYCTATDKLWSGNFLNWVSMTRMDEVRKILYGGMRSTDDTGVTVLERAFLPADAHAFAKYYNGTDIAKLTPYSPVTTAPTVSGSSGSLYNTQGSVNNVYGSIDVWSVTINSTMDARVGDQIRITNDNNQTLEAPVRSTSSGKFVLHVEEGMLWSTAPATGVKTNMPCVASVRKDGNNSYPHVDCTTPVNTLKTGNWTITNLSRAGLSFCNSSPVPSGNVVSQTSTALPTIRMAVGNYALWAANEKRQCRWNDESSSSDLQSGFTDGFRSNGNRSAYSGIGSSAENPTSTATGNASFTARVQVCVSAALLGSESCKQYPDALTASNKYKPIGLLQKYAETGNIKFGLVTPTFDHNASGGVVRAPLPGPGVNDGDFISNEINAQTGQFITGTAASKGIISNINALRIYGYIYNIDDTYGGSVSSNGKVTIPSNGCTFQYVGIAKTADSSNRLVGEGSCSSWGNPMAESYIETLRYLAGKTPTDAFASGTEDAALGMSVATTWNDPISEANFCAALNVINFNASSLSYDTDSVSGYTDLATGKTAATWTDLIGVSEGITGKSWFVGNVGGTSTADSDLCSAKTVSSFSALTGICPEVPALKGGYLIAGAAYGAHVMPIRDITDKSGASVLAADDRTSLKVNTFGVQLATNTPQIRVPVPGSSGKYVTIIPAYRLTYNTGSKTLIGGGALVDFKVISQTTSASKNTGSFYAVWEDSFAGGDYDQDMWGIISYEITGSQVKITTKAVAASTNQGQGFGYIVSGTTLDGPHFHSGIYNFTYSDPKSPNIYDATGTKKLNGTSGYAINASGGCNSCNVSNAATMAVYDVGTTDAGTLSDPLLYAAKWGGFRADTTKANGTDTPFNDLVPLDNSKWDSSGKGVPDNYFLVSDPGKLETSLDALFRRILAKISSGTAAATVATSANGTGVTYSALYEAERTDSSGKRATWAGALSGLWTDQYGLLREDGNHNGVLDDYVTDPVIEYAYQASGQRTQATRFISSDPKTFVKNGAGTTVELTDLNYLWNARAMLWDPELVTNKQRAYNSPFSDANGRYIITWVDKGNDGTMAASEIVPFVWGDAGINAKNYRYLNSDNATEAQNIISWIRGAESTTQRNRTVDYGTTTALQKRVVRLGDIINSTPLVVSAPAESYDLLYNDTSYATYRTKYRNRRQMVYVGANDGMLHAFNGGFYNTSCKAFTTQPNNKVCTEADHDLATGTLTAVTAHPLGGEVWAYVPGNLLPHLRWLTDPNYQHTYYVDGTPIAFDAKVFSKTDKDTGKETDLDTVHVGGWGTFLVVPFRLGGGTIAVDTSIDAKTQAVQTSESAYVVMDITDPESPPIPLAELRFSGARALSTPAVAMVRDVVSGQPNKFFLAIGSGPTDAKRVASSAALRVNVYDVKDLAAYTVNPVAIDLGTDAALANSFAGDLIASDFNLDGKAEALYFGSVRDTATPEFGGEFWKIAINGGTDPSAWKGSKMVELATKASTSGMPVTVRPTLGRNNRGAPMVFFGTGRMYTTADKATSAQQRIYGVIDTSLLVAGDPQAGKQISQSSLVDVTSINVYAGAADGSGSTIDGVSKDNPLIPTGTGTFSALESVFDSPDVTGWFRTLAATANNPAERVVSAQSLLGGLLLTATYIPGTSICTGLGTSTLFGLNYKTGTADPNAFFGTTGASKLANPSISLGAGLPAPPSLHAGDTSSDRNGSKKVTACTQTSTGAILCKDVVTLNPVTSGETSWREPLGN